MLRNEISHWFHLIGNRLELTQKGRKEMLDITSMEDNPRKLGVNIENTLGTNDTYFIFS
jgi:hypothetical protein